MRAASVNPITPVHRGRCTHSLVDGRRFHRPNWGLRACRDTGVHAGGQHVENRYLAACDDRAPAPPKAPSSPDATKKITPVKSEPPEEALGGCRERYYGPQDARIKQCSAVIERRPADKAILHEAYRRRADAYYEKKDYERAIVDHTKALEVDPERAKAHYERGSAYTQKDETEHALADYTRAI